MLLLFKISKYYTSSATRSSFPTTASGEGEEICNLSPRSTAPQQAGFPLPQQGSPPPPGDQGEVTQLSYCLLHPHLLKEPPSPTPSHPRADAAQKRGLQGAFVWGNAGELRLLCFDVSPVLDFSQVELGKAVSDKWAQCGCEK